MIFQEKLKELTEDEKVMLFHIVNNLYRGQNGQKELDWKFFPSIRADFLKQILPQADGLVTETGRAVLESLKSKVL